MRDPHVISLRYRVETDETTSYKTPPPVEYESPAFFLRLADGVLFARMTEHVSSIRSARVLVEEYLRAWELDTALRYGPGELRFVYEDAVVVDRNPPPLGSPQVIELSAFASSVATCSAKLHVARAKYPDPPKRFRISPDVETMWQRYQGYQSGREPLLAMAYFCFSLIRSRADTLKQAAHQIAVDQEILRKLSELSSTRGDDATARKRERKRKPHPLSAREIAWVEEAVKAVIRRLAEADLSDALEPLHMSDLPPL